MNAPEPLLRAEGLTRTYAAGEETVAAVCGVSFAIEAGDFVAITGPSGSGKSTLLGLLGCLERPSAGIYRVRGRAMENASRGERALIRNRTFGFVFQNYNLLPGATALENVELPLVYARVSAGERRRRARRALADVGLAARMTHTPAQLSGGEQQRVAIARAIVGRPDVILADEPTGSLDSAAGDAILAMLERLREVGVTLVVVSHDPLVAGRARRVMTLRDGRLVDDGAPPGASAGPGGPDTGN